MSANARKHETLEVSAPGDVADGAESIGRAAGTEYVTRGARGLRSGRPQLRMVSPLRPERASRGVFALVVTGLLVIGMVVILVINTSLAQGAFTISELQSQQAALSQQEQTLSESVAAAAAPEALERRARGLGMVPSETPVFLSLPGGKVLGRAKAAPGGSATLPRLLTPADATVAEAVNNASVGTDLPIAPAADYDPAAADAAAVQAAAANSPGLAQISAATSNPGAEAVRSAAASIAKKAKHSENSLWGDATVIDLTSQLSSEDSGLVAVPVR